MLNERGRGAIYQPVEYLFDQCRMRDATRIHDVEVGASGVNVAPTPHKPLQCECCAVTR